VLRSSGLPLSYLTDGQNVPDDIQIADAYRLARLILAI
jgi:flagellar biosynthesis protein FlhF